MSKLFIRLLIVIVLIAGITTAVYFIVNKPDKTKQLYEDYVSITKTENYENYNYLTKEWNDVSLGLPTSLVRLDMNLNNHFKLSSMIKEQIENNLLLINYANKVDEKMQQSLTKKLDNFNEKAYGKNGVAFQAKYLYTYYVSQNDKSNVPYLTKKLLVALHDMEVAGTEVLVELSQYVANNVYNSTRPKDFKYVMNDSLALIASATTSYTNKNPETDELYKHVEKYQKYITKFENYIETGNQNGFNTLNDIANYVESFNKVDRKIIYEFIQADDKVVYVTNQSDTSLRKELMTIYYFMEGENE